MKTIGIYYFSGTGNTEIVATLIKEEFSTIGIKTDLIRIEDVLKNKLRINAHAYDLIGIGSPVIGFGTPDIVYTFIKNLPKGDGQKAFIFKTAGGVAPINYNASKPAIRKLSRKGYDVLYERIFSIGCNWMVKFEDRLMKQLYQATNHKIKIMCQELLEGKRRVLHTGYLMGLIMKMMFLLDKTFLRFIGKDYRVTSSCDHCGKCIRNCPVSNIYEKKGRIQFKMSCLWCMRCVYSCPQNAIQHRLLSFCVVQGGYNIKKILESPDINNDSTGRTPPFFYNYVSNDRL